MRVVDMAMVEESWNMSFEPVGPVVFEALTEETWQFSHWEVAVSTPMPENKANPMALTLADVPYEIVTAHFEPVEFHLYVPNAFTPDNDGVNDAFHPLGAGFEGSSYSFSVFSRWGEVVFATDDPEQPWIGQNNQKLGSHLSLMGCTDTVSRPKASTNCSHRVAGNSDGRALRKGLLAMLTSVVLYTSANLCVKSFPIWARFSLSFFVLPCRCCCAWCTASHGHLTLGNNRRWLVVRGIAGMLGLAGFFHTVKHIPLASATVIQYFSPVFTVLLAFLF